MCGQMLHNIFETSAFVIPFLVFVIPSNAMLKIRNISLFSNDKATCGIRVMMNVYFTIKKCE